ncbi:uncharacterized protein LOC121688686 [Alosa sapidissima]|uniref:uncharacterized protein LOC121688686 n=1 Tax=Alosa sapidissima TaxID=34773 RepID=UPI001C0A44AC|nr:uncharacterized protein LOC121688686 [Alosa sapidissima]
MTHMIRSQEKADLSRAADFFKQVSVEITMLKQKYAELEQFLKTEDHIHFLENAVKICPCPGSESLPKVSINTNSLYEKTEKFVLSLKQRVEQILQVDFDKMSSTVKQDRIIESEEPLIRQDFLKYTTQITLDINTAYNHLSLSDGNRPGVMRLFLILIFPRDSTSIIRCWVKSVCLDPHTGKWSGLERMGSMWPSHMWVLKGSGALGILFWGTMTCPGA